MKNFIQKNASCKNILFLFGILLLFKFILFPNFFLKGQNVKLLDLQFAYTPQKAYQLIENYGEAVRKSYIIGELTIDLIYPIVYSTILSFIIFFIYKHQKIAIFPFLILITDYLENFGIVTLLYKYPQKLISVACITSFFSTLKWILILSSILIIIFGLIRNICVKVSHKKS